MRAAIIAAASLALAGCDMPADTHAPKPGGFHSETALGYTYDTRTKFCFAFTDSQTGQPLFSIRSIATVPCTAEVLALAGYRVPR